MGVPAGTSPTRRGVVSEVTAEIKKADLGKRVLAAIIDSVISWLPAVIPIIGGLIGTAYMLTRDAIVYEVTKKAEWRNASIGKKLLGLKVELEGGRDIDLAASVKRNIPFAIGTLLMIIPVLGWMAAAIIAPIIGLVECILVLVDPAGKRLGDRFAGTTVVDAPTAVPSLEQRQP